jgi:hypothetical protein
MERGNIVASDEVGLILKIDAGPEGDAKELEQVTQQLRNELRGQTGENGCYDQGVAVRKLKC